MVQGLGLSFTLATLALRFVCRVPVSVALVRRYGARARRRIRRPRDRCCCPGRDQRVRISARALFVVFIGLGAANLFRFH
jgi:hypothetical protein